MEAVGLSSRRESIFLLHFVLSLVVKTKSWFDEGNEFLERKLAEWASYRTPKQRTVVLAGPEDLEARIIPNVDLWIGPAGGDFSAANNWWINGQPGWPQDGDTLQFGGSVLAVQGANTSAVDDLPGLLSPAQVVISSNYNQTITLNNSLDVTGSMTIPSGSGVTIDGAGSLSFTGQTFNWGGGTISTNVLFGAMGGGTMTINGSDVTLNAILTNNGTLNWSSANPQQGAGPNINLGANGRIRNLGTFNIQTDSTEKITGQVDNGGTMQKTGVNTTTITGDFTNSGNLTVNSGTLNFGGLVIDSANMVQLYLV